MHRARGKVTIHWPASEDTSLFVTQPYLTYLKRVIVLFTFESLDVRFDGRLFVVVLSVKCQRSFRRFTYKMSVSAESIMKLLDDPDTFLG